MSASMPGPHADVMPLSSSLLPKLAAETARQKDCAMCRWKKYLGGSNGLHGQRSRARARAREGQQESGELAGK